MRLWSKRAKQMSLNDHGLFPVPNDIHHVPKPCDRLPIEASTERQVFDLLGVVYKEPHERDCYDAVIPKDAQCNVEEMEMTKAEVYQDGHHQWIE